ncbi:hypothetical protein SeLEV6574_g07887, partial [Synchytrium endobioticum]
MIKRTSSWRILMVNPLLRWVDVVEDYLAAKTLSYIPLGKAKRPSDATLASEWDMKDKTVKAALRSAVTANDAATHQITKEATSAE